MLPHSLINAFIPIFIGMAPFFLLVWVIVSIKKRKVLRRKNPINIHLLRSPGQTLLEKIEDTNSDLFSYLFTTPFLSLFLYVYYLSTSRSNLLFLSFTFIYFAGLFYIGYKLISFSKERESLRLGYDAELAVGQELNLLMRHGFYVFHDVNLKNTVSEFNIDHIVVGKTGVFAVETKGRSKPTDNIGKDSSKVNFDGKKLIFPQWEETEPVEQAKRQAAALQKWLSSAVGEPITARAVLALPGWFTNTTNKTDIALINGKNPEKFFNVMRGSELSDKQIKQIAHQLDNLCRNVEPKAYNMPK
ncbi:MAG: nuclease-related domain-containing protein [Methylophilus sp.]